MSWVTDAARDPVNAFGIVGGLILGYLAHRRSKTVDATSAQSGMINSTQAGTALIIEGFEKLVASQQREAVADTESIRWLTARFDAVAAEREECRQLVARYRQKYGELDDP